MIYNPKTRLIKLIDFGTALQFNDKENNPYKCVGTVSFVSIKASYIAPEVIKKHYNYTCDIWSLGVFLHLLLTGFAPFEGKSQEELFKAISNEQPKLNSPVYEKVPQAKDLVNKMLEKNPAKRITMQQIFSHPWVKTQREKQILSPSDHECMLNIFESMRRFSTLKIADFQLGVLVFMINFVVEY